MDDFNTLQSQIQSSLISTTRAASTLSTQDLPFHRSLSPQLASNLEQQNARLLGLTSSLLATATSTEESVRRAAPSLKDLEDVDGNWRAVVDIVDSLLERADTALDEFTGAVRRLSPGVEGAKNATSTKLPKMSKIATQLKAQDMEKPQLQFEHVPTNREHESGPFKPLLQSKPHAIVPLKTQPIETDELSQQLYADNLSIHSPFGLDHQHISSSAKVTRQRQRDADNAFDSRYYPHPYQLEIEQYRYPARVYEQADPIPYHPFDSTTATLVDTEEAVEEMLAELKEAKEIAIDLEHHDQRSYVGIVCLMQISTRNKDWIVDTLKPWRRKLQSLNAVFADPNIVKVLHGAYMDIVWLQRDLGLYIVGLFDTHYAARALGYPAGSLAYLLKRFANVDAQKQYQMADWRIRPLPQELFDYARSDTHYLLYIFDCMRNDLIQRSDLSLPNQEGDKIAAVLQKSSETALQRYEYPVYDPALGQGTAGWYKILNRTPALFTKEQFSVFRAVHQWRDNVAREQDDSVHYVMPNHQIFSLAREIPTNRAAVVGMCQPTTQTVRLRADEIVDVILKAKEDGKTGPELAEVLVKIEGPARNSKAVAARAEEPAHAVTNFVPKNASVASPANSLDATAEAPLAIRTSVSAFWGNAIESSVHDQRRLMSTGPPAIDLVVPLPVLTAEGFADSADGVSSSPPPANEENEVTSSPPAEELAKKAVEDDVFVIRDLKRKRGHEAERVPADGDRSTAPAQINGEAESETDEETKQLREKIAAKEAKKEARRLAKLAKTAQTNDDAAVEPINYAHAPSMLNPPREERVAGRDGGKGGKGKQVDPYKKALDTPKGLPRVQKERAGRSMSYKS